MATTRKKLAKITKNRAPSVAKPNVNSFTISANPVAEDVEITFNWTYVGGVPVSQILDPGDGTSPYSITPGTLLKTHTYATTGTFVATLTLSNAGGSSQGTISDILVTASGSTDFFQLTTLKSDTSGAHWVTPFGIPAAEGAVSSVRINKIVARYPNTDGSPLYPVQVDNTLTWNADGSLRHAAGHVKLPSGYVAMEKVGIGYSDTYSFGSAPNWTTVTSSYTADFNAKISVYNPKVVLFSALANSNSQAARPGDEWTISIVDGTGTLTYTLKFDTGGYTDLTQADRYFFNMMRMITQDASGRYKCYENMPAKVLTFDSVRNYPTDPFAYFGQYGFNSRTAKVTQNAQMSTGIGNWTNGGWSAPFMPVGFVGTYPRTVPGSAFMIWPRYHTGNPENFTVTSTITQKGRRITVDTESSNPQPGHVITYTGASGTFTAGQTLTAGNGAIAEIIKVNSGASKLVVDYLDQRTGSFVNGQTLTTATGSCTQSGSMVRNTLTGATSGASCKFISRFDYVGVKYVHLTDVTGIFTLNETINDLSGGSFRITVLPDAVSTFRFSSTSSDSTGVTSGTLPTILSPSNRAAYTATWSAGTDISLSPWFGYDSTHGRQIRQVIRSVPFTPDAGGSAHALLSARMVVSFDYTGAVVDSQVIFENNKMHAWATDMIYDVTEINVGGVNQISSILADYQQLIHVPWARHRWRKSKAFGMCDPVHFMSSTLIPTWYRHTSKDMRMGFRAFTRGTDTYGDNTQGGTEAALLASVRGGWSKSKSGLPLYAGPMKFEASGGASPSIGVYTFWEWAFWASDTFQTWPEMEAFSDNMWGAFPFYPRDEANSTDDGYDTDCTPHPFKRYYTASYASRPAPSGNKIKVACNEYELTGLHDAANPRPWSFWPGCSNGGYGYTRTISPSHSPHYPGRSAYLAVPEYNYHDMNEAFGWFQGTNRPSTEAVYGYSHPKTGGVVGDVNHQLSFSTYNGNRTFAWEWRSWIMSAATMFDRHPRKATWRRAVQSFAGHFNYNVSKHWQGMYTTRISQGSDNYQTGIDAMLAGQPALEENSPNTPRTAGLSAPMFDMFKGSYVYNTAIAAMDLEVADCTTGLDYGTGYIKMVTDLPSNKWWCFQNLSFTYYVLPDGPSSTVASDMTVFPTNDWNVVLGYWQNPLKLGSDYHKDQAGGAFNRQYVTSPQPTFYEASSAFGTNRSPIFVQNYPMYRFYVLVYQGLARHMSSSTNRTAADSIVTLLDGYIPPSQIDTAGYSLQGERYDYIWGTWSALRPGEYSTEW